MVAAQDAKPKIQVLTPEDLEAAVRMLAEEERIAPPKARGSIANLASSLFDNLLTSVFFFSLSTGLVMVWFRFWTGLKFLAITLIAFVIVSVKNFIVGRTNDFDLLKSSGLTQMAQKAWSKKFQTEGCVILPGCGLWLGGLGWLLVGLIVGWNVFPILLLPIAIGSLMMALASAVNRHRRFKYFSRVARLKERLQLLSDAGPEQVSTGVGVSEKDRELLSQVEIRQVNRAAVETFNEMRKETTTYSVAIGAKPLEYLSGLDEATRHELREALDDLQVKPRPPEAHPATAERDGTPQVMTLETRGHLITYLVDDSRQRVDVTECSPLQREVQHAS